MVREDLVEGAVTFLQDPSVAAAPIEQRVAFLRSKNLTQEEIDVSLARAGQASPALVAQQPQQFQQQTPAQYNGLQQQGYPPYWQRPPPELPRRDWRDWFIAATVMGGVGYALYWTARRYVYPLIAPPTAPQLEQDKANVDSSFEKAFALLDQLAADTKELKDTESQRKERLDAALLEVETIISKMKAASFEREAEAKRMARDISDIRDQIPKAIEKEREASDARLKELSNEMRSLKTLVSNRMAGGVAPQRATPAAATQPPAPSAIPSSEPAPIANGLSGAKESKSVSSEQNGASTASYSRFIGGNSPSIPSWQLAAKKRSEEAQKSDEGATNGVSAKQNVGESGTVTEVIDGRA